MNVYELLALMIIMFGMMIFVYIMLSIGNRAFKIGRNRKRNADNTNLYVENLNPKEQYTGDCAIRGVARLLRISWDEAFEELFKVAKVEKKLPNNTDVMTKYLKDFGYIYVKDDGGMPLRKFLKYKHGEYLIVCWSKKSNLSHGVFVNDGVFADTFNSRNYYMIGYYFKMFEETKKTNEEAK